jgi:spore germination protein GerM
VNAIQEQVTLTLKQFPSVKEVRILVDGKPDALQP